MNRKIIVFGATGNTGKEICKELQANKLNFSVFVRKGSESKLNSSKNSIIFGNVLDLVDLERAKESNNYTDIIIALGSRDFRTGDIRSKGTENIIKTLISDRKHTRVHVISANGVGKSWKNLSWIEKLICKFLIPKAMKDHELQEKIIQNYIDHYHIIRPVGLTNENGIGKVISEKEKALPFKKVSRANVAKYLVESLIKNVTGEHSICDAK